MALLAEPFTLSNAPGDGSVSVGVDGFGAFGSAVGPDAADAIFDPVGPILPAETSFQSALAIRLGSSGPRRFLSSGVIAAEPGFPNPTLTGGQTSASSQFDFAGLRFDLSQELVPLIRADEQVGSELRQRYRITNRSGTNLDFELIRYLDGDLFFDGSLVDGGGRLLSGDGREILFETDSATGTADATTFVGITGVGGRQPASGRFELDSFAGLRTRIEEGEVLDDVVTGDGPDVDQFVDAGNGFDITLALRNVFSLADGASTVYETTTIFGSGAPDLDVQSVPTPEDLAVGDRLGGAVAVDGNLFAVGLPSADVSGTDSGRVLVFRIQGTGLIVDQVIDVPPASSPGASVPRSHYKAIA